MRLRRIVYTEAMPDFADIQKHMLARRIDGWLVHDFRGNNQVLGRILPPKPGSKRWTTRRVALFIPARGKPRLACHAIDAAQMKSCGVPCNVYLTWQQFREFLGAVAREAPRLAMEYVPGAALPVMAIADAGTVELVRSHGAEVVSSADLVQLSVARWSNDAAKKHAVASRQVNAIKDAAFNLIRSRHGAKKDVTEQEVASFIQARFAREGLEYPDGPIVAVNAHAGDPHYEPKPGGAVPIKPGDWVLIDLWARRPGDENIYADITWVGYCGRKVPAKHARVFRAVKAARDAAVKLARSAWKRSEPLAGWQLDAVARAQLVRAGFGRYIKHRTGHSLSPGPMVHGLGMNLDDLETHDTRLMLPGAGFTIEPGLYLPTFGVRLEINVYVDPRRGPVITSKVQDRPLLLA